MLLKAQAGIVEFSKIITPDGKEIPVKGSNIILLKFSKSDRPTVVEFLGKIFKLSKWQEKLFDVSIGVQMKKRSIDQNGLYWALVDILSFVVYGDYGYKDQIHEELLALYAPRVPSKISKVSVPKRSSAMSVQEFSLLIMGTFYQIAQAGVQDVTKASDIRKFWREWYSWRGNLPEDPLVIKTIEDYRKTVPFCEACMTYLGYEDGNGENYIGNIAHIVTAGSGGEYQPWNTFHLCSKCHREQHANGWENLVREFPHLAWKVNRARSTEGKKPIDPIVKQEQVLIEEPKKEEPVQQEIKTETKEAVQEKKRVLLYHPESDSVHIGFSDEIDKDGNLCVVCSADDVNQAMFAVSDLFQAKKVSRENAEQIAKELGVSFDNYELGQF